MNNCKCNKNDELRIVRGNAFGMRLTVRAIHADGTEVEDFNLAEANAVLKVVHQGTKTEKAFTIINNDVVINFDGLLALGWYGFEMSGLYNGSPWRWYIEQVFCIVESNARANIPAWAVITDETYQIGITTSLTSGDIYQSDWDEENPTSPAYILNKPQIYTKAEIDGMMTEVERELDGKQPTISDLSTIRSGAAAGATAYQKPSGGIPSTDLTAELQAQIASFITASVNNLVNYYLKSDTYTKTEVQQLIDAVKQFTYESVAELPTASADTMNKIFLVPNSNPETQNVKDEYITIDNGTEAETRYTWELIGSTTIDLSGYYTALQTDAAISSALSTALADYSTTSAMNTAISTALNNYYTKTETNTELAKKTDKLPMTGAGAATENDFVAIDANGNIKDSGKNASDFQLKVEVVNITLKTYVGGTPSALIGATVIIKNTANSETIFSTTWNGSEITVDIPVGITYEIETGAVANYATPNKVGFTSYSGNVRNVAFLYDSADSVDLGLPSGLKWCTHNVGASTPEGTGSFFSWGNIIPRAAGDTETYANTPGAALTGNIPVSSTYDAARAIMGSPWRMPNRYEISELVSNCNFSWETVNGVNGARLTSKINGKSIFLPATGRLYEDGSIYEETTVAYHWSSSRENQSYSFTLDASQNGARLNDWNFYFGYQIRPVK